jgi:transcriptional regulator with XRE-family HTH domain
VPKQIDYHKQDRDRWAKIEKRRKAAHLTREELSRVAGLSVHTVNKCANPDRLRGVQGSTFEKMEEALSDREKERGGR